MIFTIGIIACTTAAEPIPSFQAPQLSGNFAKCSNYSEEKVFEYCIYQQAGSLFEIKDVHKYCSLSGNWEEACRHAWAVNRIQKGGAEPLEEVIEGCRGYSDCAFEFIDARPSRDTSTQLKRCRKYVTTDRESCIMHAMQMWANSQPSEEDVVQFMATSRTLSSPELRYASEYQYCKNWNVCTEQSKNHQKCQKMIQSLKREKRRCRRNWGKMPPRGN